MSRFRESAKGQECQVRVPGVCNFNPETTVLAHLEGGGTGGKVSDIHGAFCCSDCHDVVDGRKEWEKYYQYLLDGEDPNISLDLMFHEAVIRTQEIWLKEGLLLV